MLVEASIRVRVPVIQKRTDYKIKKQKVYEALFMDDIYGGWYLDANWL